MDAISNGNVCFETSFVCFLLHTETHAFIMIRSSSVYLKNLSLSLSKAMEQ